MSQPDFRKIDRFQITAHLSQLVARERELLHQILLVIKDLDQSRIYLDFGYPSLFAYLTEEIGYSEGSAQRRIDAARLLREVPALAEQIRTGELNLAQIGLVQKMSRESERRGHKPSAEHKAEILFEIAGAGRNESEKLVSAYFEIPVAPSSKSQVQADGSVRLELTLSAKEFADFEKAQAKISHSLKSKELKDFVLHFVERMNRDVKTPVRNLTATVAVKTIPAIVRRQVLANPKGCQHRDSATGKVCGSRWQLQVDHRQPLWAGGTHDSQNLQSLCGAHNRWKYQQEARIHLVPQ